MGFKDHSFLVTCWSHYYKRISRYWLFVWILVSSCLVPNKVNGLLFMFKKFKIILIFQSNINPMKPLLPTVYTILFLCIFAISYQGNSQNLIPNPSFEVVNTKAKILSHEMQNFGVVSEWTPVINSPDLHHPFLKTIEFRHKAPSFLGQFGAQEPRTGKGKIGMYISGGSYKEGVISTLKQPLRQGKYYYYHMYVSLGEGNNTGCTSSIGAYFTARVPKIRPTTKLPLHITSSDMICDTENWTKVCGVYKAKGTEKYISVGYFSDSPKGKSVDNENFTGAYYFIDDLMLMELQTPKNLIPENICTMVLEFTDVEYLIGESEVYPEIAKALDDYIQYLKIFKVNTVKITGYADDGGSEFENEIMASARVQNVQQYFIEKGIPETLITIVAPQEADVPTENPEGGIMKVSIDIE